MKLKVTNKTKKIFRLLPFTKSTFKVTMIFFSPIFKRIVFCLFVVVFSFFLSDTITCPILGSLVPLLWISGDVSSGFQRQNVFCLIWIVKANVMYIP